MVQVDESLFHNNSKVYLYDFATCLSQYYGSPQIDFGQLNFFLLKNDPSLGLGQGRVVIILFVLPVLVQMEHFFSILWGRVCGDHHGRVTVSEVLVSKPVFTGQKTKVSSLLNQRCQGYTECD